MKEVVKTVGVIAALYLVAAFAVGFAHGFVEGLLQESGFSGGSHWVSAGACFSNLTGFTIGLALTVYGIRRLNITAKDLGLRFDPKAVVHGTFAAVGMLAALFLVNYLLSRMFQDPPHPELSMLIGSDSWAAATSILNVVILVPISEELFVRGFLQNAMRPLVGSPYHIVVANVFFAAIHVYPAPFLFALCAGLLLSLCYERNRSMWVVVVAHASVNALVCLHFYWTGGG